MSLSKKDLLLYAVTDRTWLNGRTLTECAREAIMGGATMIQLREKDMDETAFENEAREMLELCRVYNVPLIINDNVPIAKKIGADGVHVGQNDAPADEVRRYLGYDKIIGVTAKTAAQALLAQKAGADYLGSGAVFGTSTKADALPMTKQLFTEICGCVSIPVVAIGGVNRSNITELSGCGMSGFAIVSGIFAADDIKDETKRLRRLAEDLVK